MSKTFDIGDLIEALRQKFNARNDSELARELGITPSSIGGWRRRGTMPPKYLLGLNEPGPGSRGLGNREWQVGVDNHIYALMGLAARQLFQQATVGDERANELWHGKHLRCLSICSCSSNWMLVRIW